MVIFFCLDNYIIKYTVRDLLDTFGNRKQTINQNCDTMFSISESVSHKEAEFLTVGKRKVRRGCCNNIGNISETTQINIKNTCNR